MSEFRRHALKTLLAETSKTLRPETGNEVWNLNLDQIESDTGHILAKQMVSADNLGPSTYAFEAGTVLYSKLRPYLNKVVVANDSGFATTELVPVCCNPEKLLPQYLAYFLRSSEFLKFANIVVAGAKMPRMVMSEFWNYKIPVPSLPDQRRIVTILDQADALRAKRREVLAQLDILAQSIFIELFGDHRPTTGASTALSALVEINPKITSCERESLAEKMVTFLPMASISDLEKRILMLETRPYREVSKGYTPFKVGDVLLAKITPCYENGKLAIVEDVPTEFGFGSTEFHVFRPDTAELGLFVFHLLQLDWIAAAGAKAMKGAAGQKRVPADFFGNLSIQPPKSSQLSIFADRISVINNLKAHCRNALDELDALFSSLQNRAFRGEL